MVRGATTGLHSLCVPVVVDNLPAGGGEQGDHARGKWLSVLDTPDCMLLDWDAQSFTVPFHPRAMNSGVKLIGILPPHTHIL